MKNKVLVIGGNHHNTLGIIRSLGEKDIKSYVVICKARGAEIKKSFVLKSKYIEKGWFISSYEEIKDFLLTEFSNEKYKPVIICTSDAAINQVDMNHNELKEKFYLPNAKKEGEISRLMDKNTMSNLALKVGVNVPKSCLVKKDTNLSEIEFPCITKHLNSIIGPKADMCICNNVDELSLFLQTKDYNIKFQVQKFIERDFEYQLIGCSINGGSDLIIPGYTNILRAPYNGNTGLLSYHPIDEISIDMDSIKSFFKESEYSGLFSMEFIRAKDGKDYFLETNFRNDGNAYAVTASGINLPYIWVLSCLGLNYDDEINKTAKKLISMPEFDDFRNVLKRDISLIRWFKDIKRADVFIYYDKNDLKPFFYQFYELLISLIKKTLRRK